MTKLNPDKKNANKGTERGKSLLKSSLAKYGVGRSILADKHGNIIARNKTFAQANELGLKVREIVTNGDELIVVRRDDLDLYADSKARELAYADNRVAEIDLEWDPQQFADDLASGMDLNELGFSENELEKIMGDLYPKESADAAPQIDRAAELQEKWQTASGQLWQLGEHRLLIGDCTVRENVERLMGGEKAGACVTDSPYGINREGIENDDPEGLRALFDGCLAVMPIDNGVIINFQSPRLFPMWLDAVRDVGQKFERMLWMYKSNDVTFTWRGWLTKSECIVVSSIGKAEWKVPTEYKHDCYSINWDKSTMVDVDGWHASIKPPEIVKNLIDNTVGVLYEPFAGSGTTIIAAHNLNRRCYAMEISENYGAVILERFSTAFPDVDVRRVE